MTFHTLVVILKKKPKLVFVMNQPIFLPMILYFLSLVSRGQYVIDTYSGLFLKKQWKWSLPLMKYVYRRALLSIVTNKHHRGLIESWGTKAEIIGVCLLNEEPAEPFERSDHQRMVYIGSFAIDEPTINVIEACRKLPDVKFYITGEKKLAPAGIRKNLPENVVLTDFLPRPKYVGLVQAMDGVVILVTNDNVMQTGAFEAMSWGVPVITSDWQVLRENFPRGTLFVNNSVEQIASAITELLRKKEHYKQEMLKLREEYKVTWEKTINRIDSFIQANV